jgi:hypothetical protein
MALGAAWVVEHLRWVVEMPAPPEQPVKIAGQRWEGDQLPERVAVRVRPLQHPLASSPAVLPGQRGGLLDQVFVCLAEAILVGVEGVVQRLEQAGFEDARDDQPALDVEEIFLALGQAMHVAEPTYHRDRPSNELQKLNSRGLSPCRYP